MIEAARSDRPCVICGMWQVDGIDEALRRGVSLAEIPGMFHVGKSRLRRHLDHLTPGRPTRFLAMLRAVNRLALSEEELRALAAHLAREYLGYEGTCRASVLVVVRPGGIRHEPPLTGLE